ncbi:MAG: aminopeptidase [Eubacteriales bacterium]|nr:aminopeptidase [Eubacteriales bacterium]
MDQQMEQYANLIVREGVNVQPGQTMVVNAPVQCAAFAQALCRQAYQAGAAEAVVFWSDEVVNKIKLQYASDDVIGDVPQWFVDRATHYVQKGACFVSISANDPELLKDVDPAKMALMSKVTRQALQEYRKYLMTNQGCWCVTAMATAPWAKKVFPGLGEQQAVDKLWQAILQASRADGDDPVGDWSRHVQSMKTRVDKLNAHHFDALHMTGANGTDLRIGLADDHIWCGGREESAKGILFSANIPSEEVFTAPHARRVDGKVVSTMPLIYNGVMIDGFSFTFKDGEVVDFAAREGYDTLKLLLDTDEGSLRIGEVALVPYDSPIRQTGILFYNTLFDENASCHLALGDGYATCIGGEDRTDAALEQKGLNRSLSHVDFMVGAADTRITGIKGDVEIPVFEQGNWVI